MPSIEKGAEHQWHDERRTEKLSNEREAWNKIQEVIEKYNGNPALIPLEEGPEYRSAAELLIKTAENDPDFNPKENILNLARNILTEFPAEVEEEIAV